MLDGMRVKDLAGLIQSDYQFTGYHTMVDVQAWIDDLEESDDPLTCWHWLPEALNRHFGIPEARWPRRL